MELVSIKRPGMGTLGRPIALKANHFALTVPTSGHFYHYHVDMKMMGRPRTEGGGDARDPLAQQMFSMSMRDPSIEPLPLIVLPDKMVSKEVKRRVIEILLEQEGQKLFSGEIPAFDGESNLFTTTELSMDNSATKTLDRQIVVPKDAEYRQRTVRLLIQECKPKKIAWSTLHEAVQGKLDVLPFEVISCLNTVLREAAITGNQNIPSGRSYFNENDNAFTLGKGRQAWVGFYASARPVQTQLSLNIDVSHCVFYEKGSLQQFMAKVLGLAPTGPPLQTVTDQQRKILMLDCKDLKVTTSHSNNSRTYTIKRLSKDSAAFCKFELKGEKEQITVADYFERQYNIKLKYPGLPMIETASKMYVPVELCTVLPGQKVKRKLTEDQTGTMVRACARPAPDRMRHIQDIREKGIDYDKSQHMQQFGIQVDRQLTVLEGRVLPLPKITQRKNITLPVRADDGSWDTRSSQFVRPMNMECWAVVVLDDKIDDRLIREFLSTLLRFGRDRGMTIAQPFDVPLDTQYPIFTDLIDDLGKHMYETSKKELQLVMFILGNKSQYAEIKKAGDVRLGVATQVVLGQTIFKNAQRGMPQLAGNLLLKINAKLGGINNENQFLHYDDKTYPILGAITSKITMVFGADVTHPGFGEDLGKPSVAAVVASLNDTYTEYAAEVRAQYKKVQETTSLKRRSKTQEIITDLRDMVLTLLEKFYKVNEGTTPEMIIFYRDGVSEGQYKEVMKTEVEAIREACFEAYGERPIPPITYIIVGKRHHIRLFATSPQDQAGRAKNVPPGTIADVKITHFSEFDYYLCSHGGIQGTSRPAHYHVLHDESCLSADQIQLFSFYLTFLYARCNRSVGIPTPVYYAHLAAFRARHHLHDAGFVSDKASVVSPSASSGDSGNLNIGALNKAITVSTYMKGLYFA